MLPHRPGDSPAAGQRACLTSCIHHPQTYEAEQQLILKRLEQDEVSAVNKLHIPHKTMKSRAF